MSPTVGKLVVTLVVAAALALAAVAFRARPKPPAPAPPAAAAPTAKKWDMKAEPAAEEVFGHLAYTPPQSAALIEAGHAIYAGKRPTATVSAASLAQLREVQALFDGIECTTPGPCKQYPRDVLACLDEAGELIALWKSKAEPMDRALYTTAMGVSVVTREIYYQTPAALAEYCRKLVVGREKFRSSPRTG
jgi:hypothetical protein